jgi:hypothetical protein
VAWSTSPPVTPWTGWPRSLRRPWEPQRPRARRLGLRRCSDGRGGRCPGRRSRGLADRRDLGRASRDRRGERDQHLRSARGCARWRRCAGSGSSPGASPAGGNGLCGARPARANEHPASSAWRSRRRVGGRRSSPSRRWPTSPESRRTGPCRGPSYPAGFRTGALSTSSRWRSSAHLVPVEIASKSASPVTSLPGPRLKADLEGELCSTPISTSHNRVVVRSGQPARCSP